jgi:arylsulfatase A-like enzyme
MQKNLIYIFADQWNKNAIGFEDSQVKTPHMDAFAKKSKVFDNAISTYPLCSPHRASLLTGKYPYSLGMWTNCKIGLDEVVMLKPQETTIGDVLKAEGFQTAYIGKWHLDASEKNFQSHPESGAVHWDAYTPPGERRHGFDYWFSYGAMDDHLRPHYWKDNFEQIIKHAWSPEVETDVAIEFLEQRNTDKPFCLFLSWNPPHPPYDQVPAKYKAKYDEIQIPDNVPETLKQDPEFIETLREYYGAVSGLDVQFGRLMAYLETHDLMKNSVIVLSADHGDMLGAQGLMGKNIWYEEAIKIPLMICDREVTPGRTDILFSSEDHMPTLLELLDVFVPACVEGKSFAGYLGKQMASVVAEDDEKLIMMIPGMPEMVDAYRRRGYNNKAFGWRGLRTKDTTYVVDNGTKTGAIQKRYLYDLVEDPLQKKPIELDRQDPLAQQMDKKLNEYLTKTNDPFMLDQIEWR